MTEIIGDHDHCQHEFARVLLLIPHVNKFLGDKYLFLQNPPFMTFWTFSKQCSTMRGGCGISHFRA